MTYTVALDGVKRPGPLHVFYCPLNILLNHGLKLLIFIALEEMVGNSLLWFKDYFLFQVNGSCMYFKGVLLLGFSKSIVIKNLCNKKCILFFFILLMLTYSLTTISETEDSQVFAKLRIKLRIC